MINSQGTRPKADGSVLGNLKKQSELAAVIVVLSSLKALMPRYRCWTQHCLPLERALT